MCAGSGLPNWRTHMMWFACSSLIAAINVGDDYGASFTASLGTVGTLVLSIVSFVYGIFVQAGFLSGALDLADGRPVSVGSFFKPRNFGNVILAGALLSVISAVLDSLSLLPGAIFALLALVAIAVFTFFALFTNRSSPLRSCISSKNSPKPARPANRPGKTAYFLSVSMKICSRIE